jgi:PAS domain S-box-containing protein
MQDSRSRPATPLAPLTPDVDALARGLSAEHAAALRELARERDHLVLLHEALVEVERAGSLEARLRIIVAAIRKTGFRRVAITLRDGELEPTMLVTAGLTAEEDAELRRHAAPGLVWQRRLGSLERFRVSQSYYLDARDEWIAREFHGSLPSRLEPGDDPSWSPHDSLLVPLRARDGRILATVVLDDPEDRRRPSLARVRAVELFGQQVAWCIEQASLVELAHRRAERLQRLEQIGRLLARSLDEDEIERELVRQIQRLLPADGIVVAHPDLDAGLLRTSLRFVRGSESPRPAMPLGGGPIAEVARTGRPIRLDRYDRSVTPFAAGDDVVGDGGPAGSVLAVPMLLGVRLVGVIAVHAAAHAAFDHEDEELLRTIASQAATALANASLYAESQRERRQSEALADVARAVGGSLNLADVLRLSLRHATALLRAEGATISLLKQDGLEIVAGEGSGESLRGMRLPLQGSLSGRVLRQGRAAIVNDVLAEAEAFRPSLERAGIRRTLLAPLVTAQGAIGVIGVFNRATEFAEPDCRVLQRLAGQVAVAIVNARLFEGAAEATREQQALAERHRRVVETASDGIVITDLQRRIAFANPAATRMLGRSGLLGLSVADLIAPEARDAVRERQSRAFEGEPQRYETIVVRDDGERRVVAVSTSPLVEVGRVTGTVASLRDITDERRARDAVAQSEARYRNLFETATDAIYTLDPNAVFTSANEATSRAASVPRAEILGRAIREVVELEDPDDVMSHFARAVAGEPRRYECWVRTRDGERHLLSVTNTPIRSGEEVVGVLGIARDITVERRRAEALERSEARYSRLVESASDAIFTVDDEGRFTSVNRALEHATGRARQSLHGVPFGELLDPADVERARAIFEATILGNRQRAELRWRAADGSVRTGSVLTSPVSERGHVVGALAVVRDITDEKRLIEQLVQQEKLAAIGSLVSGVAHELNNPLAGVTAFAQLLLTGPDVTPEQRASLDTIHQEARRAAKIVANLLTFARQHRPERRETDLNQVLLDTIELRRYALRVRQIELDVQLDAALPFTWADPFQLQQVMLNLLGNAEHALVERSGTRRITCRTARDGDTLVVSIADTGGGIAAADAGRIFDPFFTTKPPGQGTGLGLSISDGIVREHGGRIRVESAPGEGSTFVVEIPLHEPPPPRAAPPGDAGGPGGGGRTVLVVDDEPSIRSALTSYLASAGHRPTAVASGGEALAALERQRFDLVLLDFRMPDMSGEDVYERMRARDSEQAARVMFLTGDVQSESARDFIRATGRPCLNKPFMLDELARALVGDAPVSWQRF